jgi:hypothetical protein
MVGICKGLADTLLADKKEKQMPTFIWKVLANLFERHIVQIDL